LLLKTLGWCGKGHNHHERLARAAASSDAAAANRSMPMARGVQRMNRSTPPEDDMAEDQRDRDAEARREPRDINDPQQPESVIPDPNDEIPVPIAMFPAEVDERAQVVETLRKRERQGEESSPAAEPPGGEP
jgi:hypothetical protein